jgi:hypothetical protein
VILDRTALFFSEIDMKNFVLRTFICVLGCRGKRRDDDCCVGAAISQSSACDCRVRCFDRRSSECEPHEGAADIHSHSAVESGTVCLSRLIMNWKPRIDEMS